MNIDETIYFLAQVKQKFGNIEVAVLSPANKGKSIKAVFPIAVAGAQINGPDSPPVCAFIHPDMKPPERKEGEPQATPPPEKGKLILMPQGLVKV